MWSHIQSIEVDNLSIELCAIVTVIDWFSISARRMIASYEKPVGYSKLPIIDSFWSLAIERNQMNFKMILIDSQRMKLQVIIYVSGDTTLG